MITDITLRTVLFAMILLGGLQVVGIAQRRNQRKDFLPLVDHHQHLLSAAGAASRLPAIELPEAAGNLLREREKNWNKSEGLTNLFAEDAALFTGREWLNGSAKIAPYLSSGYTGPYRLKPVSYKLDGNSAQIAGYMVEDDGTDLHFAFFHLGLTKGPGDSWRIKSETQIFPGPAIDKPVTADQLVKQLDDVGIRQAVVVSDAYYFGAGEKQPVPNEQELARAENDWTAEQVAQFSHRLLGFCSVNPLRDYALAELQRCASSKKFTGLKIHLNAAQLNFDDAVEVAKVRRVMESANKFRLPMIIHVRSSNEYGREHAEIFLRQLIAAAPDVPIQIAHLWGGESFSGSALEVYADAVASNDPVTRHLYFDISGAWAYAKPHEMPAIVAAIRKIGFKRILYASDAPPAEAWKAFRQKVPLTEVEFRQIASNVAPYVKK
ncbi:MAG TPA: amidohydrolase family protein [Pyrinomonadaceae bacterium]|nr:amidohydrolase family protein [Pyrinomonadaceae bacterium]